MSTLIKPVCKSVTVSGVGISTDMNIDLGGRRIIQAEDGLADVPAASGAIVTKAPGKNADAMITDSSGKMASRRVRSGKIVSSTKAVQKRDRKKSPRQSPIDWLKGLSPSITSTWLTFRGTIPHCPGAAQFLGTGEIEVTVNGMTEQIPFGKELVGLSVEGRDGRQWLLSMNRRYAELRHGDFFVRAKFDGGEWSMFVQLERAPVNKNLGGIFLRPEGKVVVAANPHPLLVDTMAKSCRIHIRDNARLDVRPDWWTVFRDDDGTEHVLVTANGVWHFAHVGAETFSLHPVFSSDTQNVATAGDGLFQCYLNGDIRISGSGLIYAQGDEINFSTTDYHAYRPPGRGQMLVVDDGNDQVAAQFSPSLLSERAEWYVGYKREFPKSRPSWTPYLLVAFALCLFFAFDYVAEHGIAPWFSGVVAVGNVGGLGWLMFQGFRLARILAGDAWSLLHRSF